MPSASRSTSTIRCWWLTALKPRIGYEKAAQISLLAYREDMSLRDAALKLGYLTGEQFDAWVRPADMTHPLVA